MEMIQVMIGKNIGGTNRPITDQKWADYIWAVHETLRVWSGKDVNVLVGFDVQEEEIATLAVYDIHFPPQQDLGRVLAHIAASYRQDYMVIANGYSHRLASVDPEHNAKYRIVARKSGRHALLA